MTMIFQYIHRFDHTRLVAVLLATLLCGGCKKYLNVPLPINEIAGAAAFGTDDAAGAALGEIYYQLYVNENFAGIGSVGYLTGLYGDELHSWSTNPNPLAVYQDKVSSTAGGVTGLWTSFYAQLYAVNQALEDLPSVSGLQYKNQWMGEAYFLRGMLYFYLTNLYGDVPLVLGTDYLKNNTLARSPQADVYKQIVADLLQSQSLLDDNYHGADGSVVTDRGRPNRMAATALLSKVYLYTQDWKDAEVQADSVIANPAYQLVQTAGVFLVNSQEIIWGIVPSNSSSYAFCVLDVSAYPLANGVSPVGTGLAISLSDSLVAAFDSADNRFTNWVGEDTVGSTVYYYAYKYKVSSTLSQAVETTSLLRLGEIYLIRAEARAGQNNTSGALADLNAIRTRAGLPASTASGQTDLLAAIARERRIELFVEVGNRYFDLRRTGALDPLMTSLMPIKNSVWSSFSKWWPIPVADIQNDKNLVQTPGYN